MPAGDLVMIFRHSLGSEVFSSEENCLQQQHQQVSMGHFRLLVIIVNSEESYSISEDSARILEIFGVISAGIF